MRPIFLTLLLLLGVGVACKKQQAGESSHKLSKSDPVELAWSLPDDKMLRQDYDSSSEVSFQFPGAQPRRGGGGGRENTMTVQFGLWRTPGSTGREREVNFKLFDFSSRMGFGDRSFSIGGGEESLEAIPDSAREAMQSLPGSLLKIYLNFTNDVTRYRGLRELQEKMNAASARGGGLGGPMGGRFGAMMGGQLNDNFFRSLFRISRVLPEKSAKPGDTWKSNLTIDMGMMGTIQEPVDCEFSSWEMLHNRTVARIDFTGTFKPSTNSNRGGGFNMGPFGRGFGGGPQMNNASGNIKGISWFDPNLKTITDWEITLEGKMLVPNFGNRGGRGPRPGGGNQPPANSQATTNEIPFVQRASVHLSEVAPLEKAAQKAADKAEEKPVEESKQ